MKLQAHHSEIRIRNANMLAIHCEGSPKGTRELAERKKFGYPLANDDQLNVVDKYSVTSTYLIDSKGVIRARWLDRVHDRVDGATILKTLEQLENSGG